MNWVEFLNDNSVEFVTRGPNTARDHVSIRCPWCGDEDPSQHMGISLTSENWGCLRNPRHRGHSLSHLVAAILGCGSQQARLVVSQYSESDPESLGITQKRPEPDRPDFSLPKLRVIKPLGGTAKFWQYLIHRGFQNWELPYIIEQYNLTCCMSGPFKDRLIIPFYRQGKLIAWTGRAIIDPKLAPRYLSSALIKTVLFNEDELLQGGKLLFVVEGPFDALKLDYYGQEYRARATCTSGTSISMEQLVLLNELRKQFERVIVLFDRDALEPSFEAMDWLNAANVSLGALPTKYKDPGEMSETAIADFIQQVQHV